MFLRIAIACGADPLLIRLASSRSVPSRTPCRPFSIPQRPRVSPSNSFAPARSRGTLVIPKTTSVSTFPLLWRCRVRRNTGAPPGQSEPRYSASDDVTSSVRVSIRPCPLSTSQACSTSTCCRAVWRGGKAGLGLGKDGRDVRPQRRLVRLDRPHVVASPAEHLRADVAVREHDVAGDDLALQGQHPQEFQCRFVFVGLGIHAELGQDRFDVRGRNGHQVDPGRVAIATAPMRSCRRGRGAGRRPARAVPGPIGPPTPRSRRRRYGEKPVSRWPSRYLMSGSDEMCSSLREVYTPCFQGERGLLFPLLVSRITPRWGRHTFERSLINQETTEKRPGTD